MTRENLVTVKESVDQSEAKRLVALATASKSFWSSMAKAAVSA
jgi:hypothetical protein